MSFDLMMGREDGKRLVVIPIAPPFNFNNAVRSHRLYLLRRTHGTIAYGALMAMPSSPPCVRH
jgi:hypothetical protein